MTARFRIVLTECNWSCGDGCCSDYGYKILCLENGKPVFQDNDWEANKDKDKLLDECLLNISELIGRIPERPVDYTMSFQNEKV